MANNDEIRKELRETLGEVVKKAEPMAEKAKGYLEEAVKKAEPMTEKAKGYWDEAQKRAEPVTEKAKGYWDEAQKRAEPVTEKAKGYWDEAQKRAEPVTGKAKEYLETAAKKIGLSGPEIYLQIGAQEADMAKVTEKVKAALVADGIKPTAIKSIKLYVKPEENAVYYVANDNQYFGKVDLF